MSENGINLYDLSLGFFCEECGRPKSLRLFPGALTGCVTCDEVVTRHRCTRRPDLDDIATGGSWECPDCGSAWSAGLETSDCPDCCSECGHRVTKKRWFVVEGDRIDTAPRHRPEPFTPFRAPLSRRHR